MPVRLNDLRKCEPGNASASKLDGQVRSLNFHSSGDEVGELIAVPGALIVEPAAHLGIVLHGPGDGAWTEKRTYTLTSHCFVSVSNMWWKKL